MLKINSSLSKLPANYLFADIAKRVKLYSENNKDANIIRLGIGDVTRPIGKTIIKALEKAAAEMAEEASFRGYGPDFGYDFLKQAIIKEDYAKLNIDISEDELFISDGAKSDVANLQELFASSVKIAVCDPVYPVYVDSNAMSGRAGIFSNNKWDHLYYMPCTAENNFVPSLPNVHVDVIYLCYPNNPTGTTLSKEQLSPIVNYAIKHGSLIVYDAAYKAFIHSKDAVKSIYQIPGAKSCAIECCSLSKTAGFTGLRCAYTIVPKELFGVDEMAKKHSLRDMWARRQATKFNGVAYPIQRAAEAVFSKEGMQECQNNIDYYMKNASLIRNSLARAGYDVYGGIDAPYVWLKTPNDMTGWEFFDLLLNKANVVGTPGEGFGPSGEGYFRLTAFNSYENTKKAIDRILSI